MTPRFVALLLASVLLAAEPADPACARLAGGLCVMPRVQRAEQVAAVLGAGAWRVHALAEASAVPALRQVLWQSGALGRTAWVDARSTEAPWVDDSVELFLLPAATAADLAAYPAGQVARLLVPEVGEARVGGLPAAELQRWAAGAEGCTSAIDGGVLTLRRKALPGADAWTHWFHDAGNNAVSTDTLAAAPQALQWLGLPVRGASYRSTLAGQGVLVSLTGANIVILPSDAADACTLTAMSLGNGTPLWRRSIPWLVTTQPICALGGSSVFLAEGATVVELDLRTGRELRRYAPPGVAAVNALVVDGQRLYALAGAVAGTSVRNKKSTPLPDITSCTLLAVWDRTDGRELWRRTGAAFDPRSLALGDGRLVVHDVGTALYAHDAAQGRELWKLPDAGNLVRETKGLYTFLRPVRTGERTPYVVATDGAVVIGAPEVDHVLILDGATGAERARIDRPAGDGAMRALLVEGGSLLLAGVKGASWIDLRSGKPAAEQRPAAPVDGCAKPTLSPALSMARSGVVGDRSSGTKVADGASRSGCEPGGSGIVAGGCSVVSPQGYCSCPSVLPGGWLVRRAAARDRFRAVDTGPGPESAAQPVAARPGIPAANDWPQARRDDAGSSGSPVRLGGLAQAWQVPGAGAGRTTTPIAAGGLVIVADDRGLVRALDEADGKERWRTLLGGAVLRAPTVAEGRLLVGSGDGMLSCLDPQTGALAWRLRVPAADRRVMLYGRWSSTWPVHSGVVVHGGVAYAAGGQVPDDGVWLVAAQLADGKPIYRTRLAVPGATVAGDLRWLGGRLWLASGRSTGLLRIDPADGSAVCAVAWGKTDGPPFGADLLGYAPDVLLAGGRYLHAAPTTEADHRKAERGSAPHHQILIRDSAGMLPTPSKERDFGDGNGFLAPVWDETMTAWCDDPFRSLQAGATPALRAALAASPAAFSAKAIVRTWAETGEAGKRGAGTDVYALVLAADALVCLREAEGPWTTANPNAISFIDGKTVLPPQPAAWELLRLDRASGAVAKRVAVPGQPRLDGLCLTARGAVAVVLADGGVVLYH